MLNDNSASESVQPDASLMQSGISQPIMADIYLDIDPSITITNLVAMGMPEPNARGLVSALLSGFIAQPENRREQQKQSFRYRLASVNGAISNGMQEAQLIQNEMEIHGLTRQQAEGIVGYAISTFRSRGKPEEAPTSVSQILANIPHLAADFLAQGYHPNQTADVLSKQWKCSRQLAEAMVAAGQRLKENRPAPAPEPAPGPGSAPTAAASAATESSSRDDLMPDWLPPAEASTTKPQVSFSFKDWFNQISTRIGLGSIVALIAIYSIIGFILAAPVHSLYRQKNCQGVVDSASTLRTFYTAPIASSANREYAECQTYLDAKIAQEKQDWEASYQAHDLYIGKFPQGIKIDEMRAGAAVSLYAWAQEQAAAGEFEPAIHNLDKLSRDFSDLPEATLALKALPQFYLDWGLALSEDGYFQAAVDDLSMVSEKYINFPQAEMAAQAIPQVYIDWGRSLGTEGSFIEAKEMFKQAFEVGGEAAASKIRTQVSGVYEEWAAALTTTGKYTEAIDLYEDSRDLFPTDEQSPVEEGITGVYLNWAADLAEEEDFFGGLEKLGEARTSAGSASMSERIESQNQSLLTAFSTSTNEQASGAIDNLSKSLCQDGKLAADTPAIFGTEPENIFIRIFPLGSVLGAEPGMLATTPSTLHYVVCIEHKSYTLETCPYQQGYSVVRKQRSWNAVMYDVHDGKLVARKEFFGAYPQYCSSVHYFTRGIKQETIEGPMPLYTDLEAWFTKRLK